MVDPDRLPRPPNPGNARLRFEHHRSLTQIVLYFVDRYEGLSLVKHLYALRAQKLAKGRIRPDSVILLKYEGAFSLFLVEAELHYVKEDLQSKLGKYVRYYTSGGFRKDYEADFRVPYELPELADPFFRVMLVCANQRERDTMVDAAGSMGHGQEDTTPDLFRFTTLDEITNPGPPRPIWVRPGDQTSEGQQNRWEVE